MQILGTGFVFAACFWLVTVDLWFRLADSWCLCCNTDMISTVTQRSIVLSNTCLCQTSELFTHWKLWIVAYPHQLSKLTVYLVGFQFQFGLKQIMCYVGLFPETLFGGTCHPDKVTEWHTQVQVLWIVRIIAIDWFSLLFNDKA